MWFTAATYTVLMRGPSFEALVPYPLQNGVAVPVFGPSGSGFDSHYAGAYSILPAANGTDLLMFYHAENHLCGSLPFFGGIGLARSTDGGFTWQRRGQVLSTAAPMPTDCNFRGWGVGNPSAFRSRDGLYLYMLFTEWLDGNPVLRPDVLYLARGPIASDGEPGAWQKYADGQFSQPGLGGLGTPVIGQPPPGGATTVYAGGPSVSFNVALNRYVVVFQSWIGLHIATSEDGIQWDTPRLFWEVAPHHLGATQPWVGYISLVSSDQPTQETTGRSGYLYFARGYPTVPHVMSRRRFEISLQQTVGLYNPTTGTFFLRNSNTAGAADTAFAYGPPGAGWTPLVGDWNGDGVNTVGLYNPATGTFFLRNSNTPGPADLTFVYGPPGAGWTPLVGDWNGDGVDTVGLHAPATSTFFLRNSNTPGPADITAAYGPAGAGWTPLARDWNADGVDTLGLYNPATSTFFLRNSNTPGPADITVAYGPAGAAWSPLAGDWGTTFAAPFRRTRSSIPGLRR
ncbi:MAG: hypothetical protein ACT4P5_12650 [Armatimonadota bacterium]